MSSHRYAGKILNINPSHRKALVRNLLTSLIEHERIQTTDVRCKMLKREFDRLVTLGKKGTVAARRQALKKVFKRSAVQKLFDELTPRYVDRPGGYSRIFKLGQRKGDGAHVSIIALIGSEGPVAKVAEKTEGTGDAE
jgi:large subunit ribosomal protein L17